MKRKLTNSLLILAFGAFTLAGSAFAQTATQSPEPPTAGPGAVDPGHPRVNQVDNRLEHQQNRIEQGVKNGTLTRQQARELYRNDQRVAHQEQKDMAAHGGHLTKREQTNMNKELNHNSKQIYRAKH